MMYIKRCVGFVDDTSLNYVRKRYIIETEKYSDSQPRDDRGRWTDGGGSGGFVSGATSGALNPYSKRAQEHADRYYESVRHMKNDTQRIADATGIKKDKINKIKQHIFIKEHDLWDGHRRFDSSYEMALSWQRLIDGKRILPKDIILLRQYRTKIVPQMRRQFFRQIV